MRTPRLFLPMLLVLLLGCSTSLAAAQDAEPSPSYAGPVSGYPVTINEGTCDDVPTDAVAEIGDAVSPAVAGSHGTPVGEQLGPILLVARATVDVALDDLTSSPHTVAVHQSEDQYDTIVACGRIGGVLDNGSLPIAVAPVDDAPVVGVAIFDTDAPDLDEGQMRVTVYVYELKREAS